MGDDGSQPRSTTMINLSPPRVISDASFDEVSPARPRSLRLLAEAAGSEGHHKPHLG